MNDIVKRNESTFISAIYKHWQLYVMVLPCIVFFIVFSYIPMMGVLIAFKEYSFTKGILRSPWAEHHGMQNFIDFFRYYDLSQLIRNTFVTGFIKAIVAFPFPILFAIILHEVLSSKFKKVVQTISYLPHFISWVIISIMMFRILAPGDGAINQIIGALGGPQETYFMMDKNYFYPILFISFLWKNIGWSSIIFLAAIAGIDPEIYEAAKIDGASKIRQAWHITLAGIKPTMGILFILSVGSIVSTGFEQNYLLLTPGNGPVANILDIYVIKEGLEQGNYAYATAVGILQGFTALIMIIAANKLSRKYLEVGIW